MLLPPFCSSRTSLSLIRRNYMGSTRKRPTTITLASLALRWARKACMENTITGITTPFCRKQVRRRGASIWDVFARPWFRRVWVIQEFLASNEVKVLAGSQECTGDQLRWAVAYIDIHQLGHLLISTFDEKAANTSRQLL
jgi:hypothetical protein